MNTNLRRLAATVMLPTTLLGLAGCKTAPVNPLASQSSPALAGGIPVVQTWDGKMEVVSIAPAQRTLALRSKKGETLDCVAAPQVINFGQLQAGDKVKATVTQADVIFLAKNGPPPDVGPGVEVKEPVAAGQPVSVVLGTTDSRVKVRKLDRSYHLVTMDCPDGSTKEYKTPLHVSLKNVQPGDEAVVRATQPLAICVEPR